MRLLWFPPGGGDPAVWETGIVGHGRLMNVDDPLSTGGILHTRKSPGQLGETPSGFEVGGRQVIATVTIAGASKTEFAQRRADLVSALAARPTLPNEDVELGLLRVDGIPGQPALETRAAVRHPSPDRLSRPNGLVEFVQITWDCPSPRWRETSDRIVTFEPGESGWTSPWTSPWESVAVGLEAEVDNPADLPLPFLVRFHGEQTDGQLVQVEGPDAGDAIRTTGTVESGQFLEVDTGVVRRNVTLVEGGERTPALSRWDFDEGRWLLLPSGVSRWRWEPTSAEDGAQAVILWRPDRGGW